MCASLNLDADIHFSLTVSAHNNRSNLTAKNLTLHKILHYCFGAVAGSIRSLMVFVFSPELHLGSHYKHLFPSRRFTNFWEKDLLDCGLDGCFASVDMRGVRGAI